MVSIAVHFCTYGDKIRTFVYVLIAAAGLYLLWNKRKNTTNLLILLCTVNLFINVCFMAGPYQVCGQDMWQSFCTVEEVKRVSQTMTECKDSEADWYRMDHRGSTRAESLIQDYKGCSAYYSMMNGNIWRFYDTMAISSGICGAVHCLIGLDGRLALESLMSVKYFDENGETKQNENYLPFGVEYIDSISMSDFLEMGLPERQDSMLKRIVLEDADSIQSMETGDTITQLPYTITYQNIEMEGDILYPQEDAEILIKIEEELPRSGEGELYLLIKDFRSYQAGGTQSVMIGSKDIAVDNPDSVYSTNHKDCFVKMDEIVPEIKVKLPQDNQFSFSAIELYWYRTEQVKAALNLLKEYRLENLQYTNDAIEGDISAVDGYLFLSIPYDTSWKVYVDDVRTPTYRANVGFTAIRLRQGEHHVRIVYEPLWTKLGMATTFLGIMILCGLFVWRKTG